MRFEFSTEYQVKIYERVIKNKKNIFQKILIKKRFDEFELYRDKVNDLKHK